MMTHLGDSEHRGDAVNGKHDITNLNRYQANEQRGRHPDTFLNYEELIPVKIVGGREQAPRKLHDDVLTRVLVFSVIVTRKKELGRSVNEYCRERQEDSVEIVNGRGSNPDHDGAHDHRTENAPVQDAILEQQRDSEIVEKEQEDEEVINRKTLLDKVARKELLPDRRP
jgi:hypothetical protein